MDDFHHPTHHLPDEVTLETQSSKIASHFEKIITVCQEIKVECELVPVYEGYGRFRK